MTLTAEQHAVRASGIGGSDVAAALGISPFKTPYQLYREKVDGIPPAPIDPEGAIWGTLLEPAVAERWSQVTGRPVFTVGDSFRSKDFPFMVGHIDRGVGAFPLTEILECKTSGFLDRDAWGDDGTDEVPQHYVCQVIHYLILTGAQLGHVAALFNGRTFRRYEIKRDRELDEMVIEGERVFWRNVEDRVAPPITTLDDVKLAFPRSTERMIEAPHDIAAMVKLLREQRTLRDDIEADVEKAELAIKAYMGDADTLTVKGWPAVSWKTSKPRAGFYVKPQTEGSRVFKLKEV